MAVTKLRPVQKAPLTTDLNREIAIRELQERVNQLVEQVNILLAARADGTGLSV